MCRLCNDDRDEVPRIKREKFHLDADAKLVHFERHDNIDSWENTCITFHIRDSRRNSVARNHHADTCRIYVSELVL